MDSRIQMGAWVFGGKRERKGGGGGKEVLDLRTRISRSSLFSLKEQTKKHLLSLVCVCQVKCFANQCL